jgi:hypothetical protein
MLVTHGAIYYSLAVGGFLIYGKDFQFDEFNPGSPKSPPTANRQLPTANCQPLIKP